MKRNIHELSSRPVLLTIDEVCEMTRLHKNTVAEMVRTKQIPFTRLGARSIRFPINLIQEWLAGKTSLPIATESEAING